MAPSIFISYRRSDTGGHAGRLFDRLRHWFDKEELFFDVNSIDPGDVFPERVRSAVRSATVVLIVIGPDWLEIINARVQRPTIDYVREELRIALQRGTALPVLVGGAALPSRESASAKVRDEIGPLSDYDDPYVFQGQQADWDQQFQRLRERLANTPGVPNPRFRSLSGVEQPYGVTDDLLSYHFQDPNSNLTDLCQKLHTSDRGATRAAIHGMVGVGKTQLALRYTVDSRDRYGGVWWFRAEKASTLREDTLQLCRRVGVSLPKGEHPSRTFIRWLERQKDHWLLVFDNAIAPDDLRHYLPQGDAHHVIITSRNSSWAGLAASLELYAWTDEQSADFMADRLPALASPQEELRSLGNDLGGLPLALEQAASYMETTGSVVSDYRASIERATADRDVLDTEGAIAATGYPRSLSGALSLSFEALSASARLVLRLCSFAAPAPLLEWVLRGQPSSLNVLDEVARREREWDSLAAAAKDDSKWNEIVRELRQYGLVSRVYGAAGEPREYALVLHRLIQRTVRSQLGRPGEDCRVLGELLHRSLARWDPDSPRHWPYYVTLADHAGRLQEFYRTYHLDLDNVAFVCAQVANAHLARGDYEGARELQEWVLAERQRVLGREHQLTMKSMCDLANTLSRQGDYTRCQRLQEHLLEAHERLTGPKSIDTLTSMNNLAVTLKVQGKLRKARGLLERVMESDFYDEAPLMMACMDNLASILRTQGNCTAALELHIRAVAARELALGGRHPGTLLGWDNLALTLAKLGDLARARRLQETVLEVRRSEVDDQHPETLSSMEGLAATLAAQGETEQAQELQEQALASRRKVCGEEHADTLSSMDALADILKSKGELEQARGLQEQVLSTRERVFADQPVTLASMEKLAATLKELGNWVEARKLERRVAGNERAMDEQADCMRRLNRLIQISSEETRKEGDGPVGS